MQPFDTNKAEPQQVIMWLESSYESAGTGVVRVNATDMNLDSDTVDNFDVDVWSDTDVGGIDLTITETGEDTGIFEGMTFFSTTDDTSGHRLRVSHGDTLYSRHNDFIATASLHGKSIFDIEDRVTLDKKSYTLGDKVFVTIIATELNLDNDLIENIVYSEQSPLKITTRHFEIRDYNLVETDIDTGIFTGEIILVDEKFDENDGISIFYEYEEDKVAVGSAFINFS